MSDLDKANAAIAAMHKLIEEAMTVQGMVCISAAQLFGWTIKHAAAIDAALSPETDQ